MRGFCLLVLSTSAVKIYKGTSPRVPVESDFLSITGFVRLVVF